MVLFKLAKMFVKPTSTIRLAPYVLIIPIVLFISLSLSGCLSTSPAIPEIYLVSLESAKNTSTPVEVRVGYFGICGDDGTTVRCQSARNTAVEPLTNALFPSFAANGTNKAANATAAPPSELRDLVATAIQIEDKIFGWTLVAAGITFFVGLVCLFIHKRHNAKPETSKPFFRAIARRGTYGSLCLSTGLIFASALATLEAATALEAASRATSSAAILMHAGRTIQVLQWMAFGFSLLFNLAVPILVSAGVVQTLKDMTQA
ncbi:Ca2+ regulator and membrane fusion protein Fig1-domain-containing protein [Cercophora newfieldiana]|uniref:Ca2+ regulator and membrane fusion protein Fig1-domain-containing protein n=1 Tax=Cercophora newfieldiana TaxID=92897 RepID=A0AA39YGX4_9PEZI|nr:Ca2+ regulator and membrane fusion protein Fig1-domain-containing protein [Cercophora newfieldiana]